MISLYTSLDVVQLLPLQLTASFTVFPALVLPRTLGPQAGPGHVDAGGHLPLLSPPPPSALPPLPFPTMAMSSDPGCERLNPSDEQTSSLTDSMAAMTTKDSGGSATNGVRNDGAQQDGGQAKRTHPMRPHLSGRKLSLQERGTYLSSGPGRGYTHISPRVARRPTVESKRVSISDSQVRIYARNNFPVPDIFIHVWVWKMVS